MNRSHILVRTRNNGYVRSQEPRNSSRRRITGSYDPTWDGPAAVQALLQKCIKDQNREDQV